MKDRDATRKKQIKASEIRRGRYVEVDGQRIRCDRFRLAGKKGGKVKITQVSLGGGRARSMTMSARKHVELIVR